MANYILKRTFIGQLPHGSDLYEGLTEIVQREGIRTGRIHGIGATMRAVVAYYDQTERQYNQMEFDRAMEILSLQGNVSLRDGKPFVHVHIVLGDRQGHAFGGHVMPGTKVFVCEVFIEEFDGEDLHRAPDEKTGLPRWRTGR